MVKQGKPVSHSKVKSVRLASTDPPAEPKTETMKRNSIQRDRAIDANVDIEPTILAFLYSAVQKEPTDEINGFGHVDESGLLDWASIVSVGSSGAVESTPADMAWATVQCLGAVKDVPNMQLHTHPGFDTFYSGTDVNDIVQFVKETRDSLDVENGAMYFMVFNMTSWLVRRVEWSKEGAFFNDGKVSANGIPFQDTITKAKAIQSGYGGQGVHNYNNNFTGHRGGTVVKQVQQPASPPAKKTGPAKGDPTPAHQTYLVNGEFGDGSEGWWESQGHGGGALLEGYNQGNTITKKVPVLMEYPLDNEVEIRDIVKAYKSQDSLLGCVLDAGYYDILEIRNHLKFTGSPDVWDALVKEMREADRHQSPSKGATEDFVVMIQESVKTGNIADAAIMLDVCDWFTGCEVLDKLKTVNEKLHSTLVCTYGGYTFGMLLILISENLNRAPSEKQAMEANQKMLAKLPKDVCDRFTDFLAIVWDDTGKVVEDGKL